MTPFEELNNYRRIGGITYPWLVSLVIRVARKGGFPAPDPYVTWSKEAAREWLHSFIAAKGPVVMMKMLVLATDQESLERLTWTTLHRGFIDEARAQTAGKLRVRLRETILPRVPDFVDRTAEFAGTSAWGLTSSGDSIWQGGDWQDLLRAPGLRLIEPLGQLNPSGPTSARNIESLVAAARVLLDYADGALTDQVLASALTRCFELDDSIVAGFEESDPPTSYRPLVIESRSPEQQVENEAAADEIMSHLSAEEQFALPFLDETGASFRKALPNLRGPRAFAVALKAKLQESLMGVEDAPGTLAILMRRCAAPPTNL